MSGRRRLPSAPPSRRHTPPEELGPGACRSSTFLDQAAKPGAGGSPALVVMSVALSNRFQGRRHCPPRGRAPLPRPRPADRPPPPSPARGVPCPPLRRREAGAGAGPGARGRADPRLPGRLFVSSRREGVRLAQSPAGEEAGGDQQGKRTPPPSLVQPRRWGSSRGAPKPPNAPRAPPPSRGCACCQINPLPLHPPGSPQCPPSAPALVPRTPGRSPSTRSTQLCSGHLGLQVVTLRLAD